MRDHEHDGPTDGIKVVDRRRFTAEGEVRADAAPEEDLPRRPPPPPAPARPRREKPAANGAAQASQEAADAGDGNVDFLSFLAQLATQALASLGALPEARARGIPVNPQMAREYIDILMMLRHRTRGNLGAEEDAAFKRLLGDLQLQYVQATQPRPPPPPGAGGMPRPPGL